MINEDDGGALGSMAAMLGQFGLGMGSSESNLDKIMELSRARRITQAALFTPAVIEGQEKLVANHMIESLKRQKKWSKKSKIPFLNNEVIQLEDFTFSHDSFPLFNIKENKALKKLHTYMVGKNKTGGAFQSSFSELSGIMNFSVTTDNPELSIITVNNIYDRLSSYYVEKSAEKQTDDYKLIKSKYDSIQTRLNSVQYSIAKFDDENQGLIRRQDQLRKKQLQGEELKLASMLAEAEKQFQISQLSLESKTAYIQEIDKPLAPLKPVSKSRLYFFLLGGFLGGIFSIIFIIAKKMILDILNSP